MSISVRWLDPEQTILLQNVRGHWTVEDYQRVIDETSALLTAAAHPSDIIVDFTRSAAAPSQILSLAEYAEAKTSLHRRMAILVNASSFIKSIIEVAKPIAPKATASLSFTTSRQEAMSLITQSRDKSAFKG